MESGKFSLVRKASFPKGVTKAKIRGIASVRKTGLLQLILLPSSGRVHTSEKQRGWLEYQTLSLWGEGPRRVESCGHRGAPTTI